MIETPGFFVCNTRSLHLGRRFSALNVDEDLETANVYVKFPMKRMHSIVTTADIGDVFLISNSAAKRASLERVKILPKYDQNLQILEEPRTQAPLPKFNFDDIEELFSPQFKHRLSMRRSKKALLETIAEEPIC